MGGSGVLASNPAASEAWGSLAWASCGERDQGTVKVLAGESEPYTDWGYVGWGFAGQPATSVGLVGGA